MKFCKIAQKEFENFDYEPVVWSADSLPVCPWCGRSVYDDDYSETHETKGG